MSFITQLGNWLRKISTSVTSLSVSGRTLTYTRHNNDSVTIPLTLESDLYVKKTGDTVTGSINSLYGVDGVETVNQFSGEMAGDDLWAIRTGVTGHPDPEGAETGDNGFLEIATADNGTEPIYISQYIGDHILPDGQRQGERFYQLHRSATLLDEQGNTFFPGMITAASFNGTATRANYAISAGSATSAGTASKLGTSDVGSATQPIYLEGGVATACTYQLHKTVPADAKFTDTVYTIGTASGSGNAITALSISGSTITPTLGKTFSESTHTHSYLPLSGGTMTDIVTLDKGDHPAAGALSSVLSVTYKNTANSISHTTSPIDYIGNDNTSNNYNTGIRLGSRDGTTILSAGESGSTFASVLQKYDDENLYLVADGSINLYTNCANNCSSYKGPITITNNTITADDFVGKISGHTVAADVPSNAVFTDTHWTSHLYAGASNGVAHATTTNGNTHLILCDNSTARNRIKITGTGATTVTSDANGVITIHSTDNNTDTKVTATKITFPSSATNYYLLASSSDATATEGVSKFGMSARIQVKAGTTSAEGETEIVLGNNTAVGTAGNTTGDLCLYNDKGKYSTIRGHAGDTSHRSNYLPKASGTLVCHTTDTAIGSATKPVYVNTSGVATACTYELEKSVPSDAKFTDTVYTHPTTAGNKHIPSGGSSGQFLKYSSSGTAVWASMSSSDVNAMPYPHNSSGVGQLYQCGTSTGKEFTLPSGGTWFYVIECFNANSTSIGTKVGTAAGKTKVTALNTTDTRSHCWAIRIA